MILGFLGTFFGFMAYRSEVKGHQLMDCVDPRSSVLIERGGLRGGLFFGRPAAFVCRLLAPKNGHAGLHARCPLLSGGKAEKKKYLARIRAFSGCEDVCENSEVLEP